MAVREGPIQFQRQLGAVYVLMEGFHGGENLKLHGNRRNKSTSALEKRAVSTGKEEGKVNERPSFFFLYLSCIETRHTVCIWNMKEKNINSIFEQFAAQFCGRTLRECRPQHVVLPSRTSVMEVWQQPAFSGANTSKYKQSNSLPCSHAGLRFAFVWRA